MDWSVTESEDRANIYVNRPKDDRGLYRAWAVGPGGRCLLGTLTPQGDRLTLRKTLRISALDQAGCWPLKGVECQLSFPFQAPVSPPPGWGPPPAELCWRDEAIQRTFQAAKGGLYRRTAEGFLLAYPLDCRSPFPLPPLFCFARLRCLAGRPWWVFAFGPDRAPRFEDA